MQKESGRLCPAGCGPGRGGASGMRLDPEEIAGWKLSDQHLEDAIRELRVTGYVIFESVLDAPRGQELHRAFMEIFERCVGEIGDNRGKQLQGGAPPPIEGVFAAPD